MITNLQIGNIKQESKQKVVFCYLRIKTYLKFNIEVYLNSKILHNIYSNPNSNLL